MLTPVVTSAVLEDPRYRVPAAPPAASGLAWLRSRVPRFCDGPEHARRRAVLDDLLTATTVIPNSAADPAVVLIGGLGLPAERAGDVARVAAAYQPHAPQSAGADAALERLVAACGGRSDATAARLCLLVQAYAGLSALARQRREGRAGPPVPTTRRVAPDGTEVEVDLTDAPFGRGPHACPGRALAEAWSAAWREGSPEAWPAVLA
ncbi:hypothetical protein ACI78R_22610 [Geodermatophilus sp. SYSU D01106]